MDKKIHVIFPDYATDIISEILESFGLKKREEEISEKIYDLAKNENVADNEENMVSLYDKWPSVNLAKMAKKIGAGAVSEQEASLMIAEKMELDKENAVRLLEELKNKLVALSRIVEEEAEISKEEAVIPPEEEKEEEEPVKPAEGERERDDPYRETIE